MVYSVTVHYVSYKVLWKVDDKRTGGQLDTATL